MNARHPEASPAPARTHLYAAVPEHSRPSKCVPSDALPASTYQALPRPGGLIEEGGVIDPLQHAHQDLPTQVSLIEQVKDIVRRPLKQVVFVRLHELSERPSAGCIAEEESQGCAAAKKDDKHKLQMAWGDRSVSTTCAAGKKVWTGRMAGEQS